MRRALLPLALVALALAAGDQPPAADDKGKTTDKEQLQGTWAVIGAEADGQPLPEGQALTAFKKTILTFDGDNLRNSQHPDAKGTFVLDTTKKPRTLDIITVQGTMKRRMLFVYELNGDTLKVCFGLKSGEERPTDVTSKNRQFVLTLKRDKKPDK